MELASAQKEFVDILQRVDSTATLNQFLKWIQENWFRPEAKRNLPSYYNKVSIAVIIFFSNLFFK